MEKQWKTKKQLRDRIDELKHYNDYLRDEVATQHGKYLATRKQSELLFSRIDLAQKELYKKVHESRRDNDESIFAIGWNQACSLRRRPRSTQAHRIARPRRVRIYWCLPIIVPTVCP